MEFGNFDMSQEDNLQMEVIEPQYSRKRRTSIESNDS